MEKKIAILRGINVGGKRKIMMADLKDLCKKMELENINHYIQSGNLMFNSNKQNIELESMLEQTIKENFGFDVPVIVRSLKELQNSIEKNPFYNEKTDINQLHLTFLKEKPRQESIEKIMMYNCESDQFNLDNKEIFILCVGKYHQSKLTNSFFEKKLKVRATTRNWRTVLKLLELSRSY